MKTLALSLVVSLAFVQPIQAATSALIESLREYEAITTAIGTDPKFQDVIPQNEFIVDIERATRQVDSLGKVYYRIITRSPAVHENVIEKYKWGKDGHDHTHTYIAKLLVIPNPEIGRNIITVEKIKQIHGKNCKFCHKD